MLLVLAVVLACGWAVQAALAAADHLERARTGLTAVRDGADSDLDVDRVGASVASARAEVAQADQRLSHPVVRLVAAVPLLGRSVGAERAVVDAAAAALRAAAIALAGVSELGGPGGIDARALAELGDDLEAAAAVAEERLTRLEAAPTGLTPPVVRDGVETAAVELKQVVTALSDAGQGATVAAALLGAERPRRLLVALLNNAELRGAGGNFSTYATGVLEGGEVELSPFRDVVDVIPEPDQAVPLAAPEEFVADYGPFLAHTTLWRNWTMSPDVPAGAAVAAQGAHALLGERPDVVMLLDVPAMAGLVRLGVDDLSLPDGTRLDVGELDTALLVDTYAAAGRDTADQAARRNALQAAAGQAATSLLTTGGAQALDLVRELAQLARGRHLVLWSAEPGEQAALERLGLAGAVQTAGHDLAMVTSNNLNGTKLDYYVDRDVTVEAVVGHATTEVVQRVRLTNRAPDDLVPYVAGLRTPGRLDARVEFSLSPSVEIRSFTVDGAPPRGGLRTGTDRIRAFAYVELQRGDTLELEVAYRRATPDGSYRLRVAPQPLARDAALQLRLSGEGGQPLSAAGGVEVVDGAVIERSELDVRREVQVGLQTPSSSVLTRLRRAVADFWSSPVELG